MATDDETATPAGTGRDGGVVADAHTVESLIRERLSSALGGARGSFETALPTVAFVVAWAFTHEITIAVGASVAIVLTLLVVRLATRQTPRYVLAAVFATAIAAFFALRSGKAEAAFLPGILTVRPGESPRCSPYWCAGRSSVSWSRPVTRSWPRTPPPGDVTAVWSPSVSVSPWFSSCCMSCGW